MLGSSAVQYAVAKSPQSSVITHIRIAATSIWSNEPLDELAINASTLVGAGPPYVQLLEARHECGGMIVRHTWRPG